MRSKGILILALALVGAFLIGNLRAAEAPTPHPVGEAHREGADHVPSPTEHVADQPKHWVLFETWDINLPLVGWFTIAGYPFPTKFMWLTLLAAFLVAYIYIGLARRMRSGEPVTGPFWNAWESLLTFVRDEIAKPSFPEHHHDHGHEGHAEGAHAPAVPAHLEEHPADKFVPFLWTLFLFILFCNLLGLIPFLGSPTANLYMTGGLAICVLIVMHGAPIVSKGLWPYLKSLWPPFEMPLVMAIFIKPLIFFIELMGTVIKSLVLAIRLFANMFAGHTVLASILLFIVMTRTSALWPAITAVSVIGVVALSLLELFVALLQAYIFVFLAALFMGMSMNPEH